MRHILWWLALSACVLAIYPDTPRETVGTVGLIALWLAARLWR